MNMALCFELLQNLSHQHLSNPSVLLWQCEDKNSASCSADFDRILPSLPYYLSAVLLPSLDMVIESLASVVITHCTDEACCLRVMLTLLSLDSSMTRICLVRRAHNNFPLSI